MSTILRLRYKVKNLFLNEQMIELRVEKKKITLYYLLTTH